MNNKNDSIISCGRSQVINVSARASLHKPEYNIVYFVIQLNDKNVNVAIKLS